MGKIESIIFDCDGVMFNSHRANLAYYNRILAEFSYPLVTPEQKELAHLCHTASSPEVLQSLFRAEDLTAARAFAATLDYHQFIPGMEPEEGFFDLLQQLQGHYLLAVATNRGKSIEAVLDYYELNDFFSAVVTCHDVPAPKPAPDMLLLIAEQLQVKTSSCLFIGDSALDRQAAEGAGMSFIGYGGMSPGDINIVHHRELPDHLR